MNLHTDNRFVFHNHAFCKPTQPGTSELLTHRLRKTVHTYSERGNSGLKNGNFHIRGIGPSPDLRIPSAYVNDCGQCDKLSNLQHPLNPGQAMTASSSLTRHAGPDNVPSLALLPHQPSVDSVNEVTHLVSHIFDSWRTSRSLLG